MTTIVSEYKARYVVLRTIAAARKRYKSEYIVNTDKAFDLIGEEVGYVYFILAALGTVSYAFFITIHGIAYDHDRGYCTVLVLGSSIN